MNKTEGGQGEFSMGWKQLVEILDVAVFIYQDGALVYVNQRMADLLEAEPDALIGRVYWDFIHPDQRDELQARTAARSHGEALPKRFQVELITSTGAERWAELSTELIDYGGEKAVFGTALDVTDRVAAQQALTKSESLFRNLTESTPVAIFIHQGGLIAYANPAFSAITGYDGEEILGKNFWDFIHEDSRELVKSRGQRRLGGDRPPSGYAVKFVRKDGSLGWVELMGKPIEYRGAPAILGTGVDISEQRRAEAELLQSQKLESLGVLAGGIAHDFNNIVTVILSEITMARWRLRDDREEACRRLESAEKAALQARDLTQQILTFSQGGAPVRKEIRLGPLLEDSIEFALSGANVECRRQIADRLWTVRADQGQLRQVIHNLIINANQAMPDGGTILVTAENLELEAEQSTRLPAGPYVRLSVHDHGQGIAPQVLPKIFDPYFTTKDEGTGLGLATSYSIIKRHNGVIQVDSRPGFGSTVQVYLPATPEVEPEACDDREISTPGTGKVLLMDDDQNILEVVSELLEVLGYRVETASDGQQAIACYAAAFAAGRSFDVVIMDLTVPGGMGGAQALPELRKIDPHARVIVSSGYCNDPVLANFQHHGFDDIVTKPFTIDDLARVIESVTSR